MTRTSSLSMIQLQPDIRKVTDWMARQPRRLVRPGHDEGYGWHAILAAAFGELAPKPFLVVEKPERPVQILGYTSVQRREDLLEIARLQAEPFVYDALGVETFAIKPIPATFEPGQRFGFEVRVRPTVRQDYRDRKTDAVDRRRSRERDAFLAAVDAEAKPRGDRPEINRVDVYRAWLAARLGTAAKLDHSSYKIVQLRRTMLLRPRQDGGRELKTVGLLKRGAEGEQGGSPDAVMQGTLVVSEPDAFQALLARGIGRHLAFGFGMLLLRPPTGR